MVRGGGSEEAVYVYFLARDLPARVTMLRSGASPVRTSLRVSNDVSGGHDDHGEESRATDVGGGADSANTRHEGGPQGLCHEGGPQAFATKEDLKAFATKEELKAFPTRVEMEEKFEEAKRFALVLHEDLKGDIALIAEHLADVMTRLPRRDL